MASTVLKGMRRVQRGLTEQGWPAEVQVDEANSRLYLEVIRTTSSTSSTRSA